MPPGPRWSRMLMQRTRPTSGTSATHSVPSPLRSACRVRSGARSMRSASTSGALSGSSPSSTSISPSTRSDGLACAVTYSVVAPRAAARRRRRSSPATLADAVCRGCGSGRTWLRASGRTTAGDGSGSRIGGGGSGGSVTVGARLRGTSGAVNTPGAASADSAAGSARSDGRSGAASNPRRRRGTAPQAQPQSPLRRGVAPGVQGPARAPAGGGGEPQSRCRRRRGPRRS